MAKLLKLRLVGKVKPNMKGFSARKTSESVRGWPGQVWLGQGWPGQAKAAISLTYDDGMRSHYQIAAPQLVAAGLRGTFFVNAVEQIEPWLGLIKQGHEIAAHTQRHPCPRAMGLVGGCSEELDLDMMAKELEIDVAQLGRLGQPPPYTFAYPCGITWIGGGQSYVKQVRERFIAARLADGVCNALPSDLHLVPAQFGLSNSSELLAAVDQAARAGNWLVLGFHGIGEGALSTDANAHADFVRRLGQRNDIWVAPFREVAQHLQNRLPSE